MEGSPPHNLHAFHIGFAEDVCGIEEMRYMKHLTGTLHILNSKMQQI